MGSIPTGNVASMDLVVPSVSPVALADRDVSKDVWPGCSGDMTIENYIRYDQLANAPSFGRCHQRWASLGFPSISTDHWPRLGPHLPTTMSELLPAYETAAQYFVARAAAHWYGKPLPDLKVQDIAAYMILELVATADLVVYAAKIKQPDLPQHQQLDVWRRCIHRRTLNLGQYITRKVCLSSVVPGHDCLLRACFVSVRGHAQLCST